MANRRCPKCGEEYSDTYRSCPFCEEEDALKHGKTLHRRGGRRVEKRPGRTGGAGGIMLLLSGIIILGVVGYIVFGDDLAEAVGIRSTPEAPPVSDSTPDKIPAVDNTDRPTPDIPLPDVSGSGEDVPGSDPAGTADEPSEPAGPLALSQTDITIPVGETGRLTATGGSGALTWTSSNPEIAAVDGGAVTGKAGGTVTVTVSSGEETASCQVKVEGEAWVNPNAGNIKLNKTDFTFPSGETVQMKVTGTESAVVWASNNPNIAAISEMGVVSWVSKGTTTVTATVDGVTLECIVRAK